MAAPTPQPVQQRTEQPPASSSDSTESRFVGVLRSLLLVWGAGVAPLIIAVLAVYQILGPPPEVEIRDMKTLIEVLERSSQSILANTLGPVSAVDRQRLAETAANLDRVVTTTFGARHPNLDPFVLKQNESLDLLQPTGDATAISVGRIFANQSYLYVTVDGSRRQLYVGQRAEFGARESPCAVTLRAIDEPRLEASFDFRCR